jgi:hypothetical protein
MAYKRFTFLKIVQGVIARNLMKQKKFVGSVETDMNLCGSLPNHENRNAFDGTLLQGLRGTAGRVFFELFVIDPPRGRPVGGGGNHRK